MKRLAAAITTVLMAGLVGCGSNTPAPPSILVFAAEADAGLVYVTDARSAGDTVMAVPFPEAAGAVNTYPVAVLKRSANSSLARKFVDLVTGEQGQQILGQAGFGKP